jgi:hypothetical protein
MSQQRWGAAPRVSRERKPRGQSPGALLQAIDAEQFTVEGAGMEPDQRERGSRPRKRTQRRDVSARQEQVLSE